MIISLPGQLTYAKCEIVQNAMYLFYQVELPFLFGMQSSVLWQFMGMILMNLETNSLNCSSLGSIPTLWKLVGCVQNTWKRRNWSKGCKEPGKTRACSWCRRFAAIHYVRGGRQAGWENFFMSPPLYFSHKDVVSLRKPISGGSKKVAGCSGVVMVYGIYLVHLFRVKLMTYKGSKAGRR